jgi:formylglycine-generating enzyme
MRSKTLWMALVPALSLVAAGCAALVGIDDFGAGNDGGPPDGTVADDSGSDGPIRPDTGPESGADSAPDGAREAGDGGACTPGAQQCSASDGGIDTCGLSGQWTIHWSCVSGACADDACTNPPSTAASCQDPGDGLDDCGASSENCCTSLEVPGGTYFRGYTNSGNGATQEQKPATISNFRLDKYDVTVGRFRQFVDAVLPPDGGLGWSAQEGWGIHEHLNNGNGLSDGQTGYETGWATEDDAYVSPTTATLQSCNGSGPYATWTSTAQSNEKLPMTCVNWYEAYAFCIWDGGFLPSEAEWEYAAAGGSQQREYPWGSMAPGTANAYAIYDCYYGPSSCMGFANFAPVGFAASGAGAWGQLDLTGNVVTWLMDGPDIASQYFTPCVDCANLNTTSGRCIRGSQMWDDITSLPVAVVNVSGGTAMTPSVTGFRCARVP